MKTAVSVIVPCYNVAPYVDECMSGLAEQTLGPMEIICVDDGSTDGTLELLYRWREKDNRLRVISQSNAGVSAARNAGLDAAEGKYVGFVDPDDRVDRRMFSRLLGAAEKNDADVVVCGCREFVEKDGVVVHEGGWSPDDEFIRRNGWSNSAAVPPGAGAWVPYTTNWSAEAWWKNIPSVLWWA